MTCQPLGVPVGSGAGSDPDVAGSEGPASPASASAACRDGVAASNGAGGVAVGIGSDRIGVAFAFTVAVCPAPNVPPLTVTVTDARQPWTSAAAQPTAATGAAPANVSSVAAISPRRMGFKADGSGSWTSC
jgi:hypothetical protein